MPAPTTGLVLHWNLTTRDGSNYDDLTANGNDGIPVNSPSFTTGTVGNSIHLTGNQGDAAATAVSASTFVNLPMSAPGTWCAWLRSDAVGATRLAWMFGSGLPGNNFRAFGFFAVGATTVWAATGGPSDASSVRSQQVNPNVRASVWYHLAVTYNATQASGIYINGTYASSPSYGGAFWGDPAERVKRIGNNLAGSGWVGDIDEFRVYNRILSSDEINSVFADATSYPVVAAAGGPGEKDFPVHAVGILNRYVPWSRGRSG